MHYTEKQLQMLFIDSLRDPLADPVHEQEITLRSIFSALRDRDLAKEAGAVYFENVRGRGKAKDSRQGPKACSILRLSRENRLCRR